MKRARADKSDTAPTKMLLTHFDTLHQEKLGVPALIRPGKDAALVAWLWRTHGDLVPELMGLFFQQNSDFIRRAGYTVGVFSSQFGKLLTLRAELAGLLPERDPETTGRENAAAYSLRSAREFQRAVDRAADELVNLPKLDGKK